MKSNGGYVECASLESGGGSMTKVPVRTDALDDNELKVKHVNAEQGVGSF